MPPLGCLLAFFVALSRRGSADRFRDGNGGGLCGLGMLLQPFDFLEKPVDLLLQLSDGFVVFLVRVGSFLQLVPELVYELFKTLCFGRRFLFFFRSLFFLRFEGVAERFELFSLLLVPACLGLRPFYGCLCLSEP